MQTKLYLAGALIIVGLGISACKSDVIRPDNQELYEREFLKTFGTPSASHTWNMATTGTVTVTAPTTTEVKVYARVNGKRYLFAHYRHLTGTENISFDLPKDVKELEVRANGRTYRTKTGGHVDLTAGSRTIAEGTKASPTEDGPTLIYGRADDRVIHTIGIDDMIEAVPENTQNVKRDGLTSSFYFISEADKDLVIYPCFWNSSSSHVLGVYWYEDPDSPFEWYNHDNPKYFFKGTEPDPDQEYYHSTIYWGTSENDVVPENLKHHALHMKDLYWTRSGEIQYAEAFRELKEGEVVIPREEYEARKDEPGFFNKLVPTTQVSYTVGTHGALKTGGVKIRFDRPGVKFGIYLKVSNTNEGAQGSDELRCDEYHHLIFSESRLNQSFGKFWKCQIGDDWSNLVTYLLPEGEQYSTTPSGELMKEATEVGEGGIKAYGWNHEVWESPSTTDWEGNPLDNDVDRYAFASFKNIDCKDGINRTFFGFEDWPGVNMSAKDLNDVIFFVDQVVTTKDGNDEDITPEQPQEEKDDTYRWLIAAEDLGAVKDWDFNDVVFEVSVKTVDGGKKEVKVKGMASGGTLPVYLMLDRGEQTYIVGQEFHRWFGNHPHTKPLNVLSTDLELEGKEVTLSFDSFSLADGVDTSAHYSKGLFGGFWIYVKHDGKPLAKTLTFGTVANEALNAVTPDEIGNNTDDFVRPPHMENLAPQMFIVPCGWYWPTELTPINEVYNDFENWVTQEDSYRNWIDSHNGGPVVKYTHSHSATTK